MLRSNFWEKARIERVSLHPSWTFREEDNECVGRWRADLVSPGVVFGLCRDELELRRTKRNERKVNWTTRPSFPPLPSSPSSTRGTQHSVDDPPPPQRSPAQLQERPPAQEGKGTSELNTQIHVSFLCCLSLLISTKASTLLANPA